MLSSLSSAAMSTIGSFECNFVQCGPLTSLTSSWKILESLSYGGLFLSNAMQLCEHEWGDTGYSPTG
jgi:hypothetical protein